MSTTHDTKKVPPRRDIERGTFDQRAFACIIMGRDGSDYWHIYDQGRDLVVVLDETGIDLQQGLEGHRVGQWLEWVEDKRGWKEQYHFDLMYDVAVEEAL